MNSVSSQYFAAMDKWTQNALRTVELKCIESGNEQCRGGRSSMDTCLKLDWKKELFANT